MVATQLKLAADVLQKFCPRLRITIHLRFRRWGFAHAWTPPNRNSTRGQVSEDPLAKLPGCGPCGGHPFDA
eukprot:9159613-Alexandrium_andersonii.AAC.1